MPTSRNINTYSDVREVLDTALDHGGLVFRLKSPGKAKNWRQRAYTFRSLLQRIAEERLPLPGYQPGTPYDELVLEVEGCCVNIALRKPEGEMLLPDGRALPRRERKRAEVDDLIEQFRAQVEDD